MTELCCVCSVLCYMPWPLNPSSVICLACRVATLHTTTLAHWQMLIKLWAHTLFTQRKTVTILPHYPWQGLKMSLPLLQSPSSRCLPRARARPRCWRPWTRPPSPPRAPASSTGCGSPPASGRGSAWTGCSSIGEGVARLWSVMDRCKYLITLTFVQKKCYSPTSSSSTTVWYL